MTLDLTKLGIHATRIHHNLPTARLYEMALEERGNFIAGNGALVAYSGEKTGRSPKSKRIVEEETTRKIVWWGSVNKPLAESSFEIVKQSAIAGLNALGDRLYVVDGFAAWDKEYRIKVRLICARAYHALFMKIMLIRPTAEEHASFGEPDWIMYNCGHLKTSKAIPGVEDATCPAINFKTREMVILGTEYAGEMKKGVFTVLNYELPLHGVLSMHCSANEGDNGDAALFFGLSGTGKTTLSADPRRALIGDDEHGWDEGGVFNFEGGCYAKVINLSAEKEPEIFQAIRYGAVLENVVLNRETREINYEDSSITENTRVAYPVEFIPHAKIPCEGGHPKNVVFLTCDAFGVLPPVSRLTGGQAMYHFISGYTAKVAGTEQGVDKPQETFSACFGAAFLVWHPAKYAELLADKLRNHEATTWLVNTGWSGGGPGVGSRFSLKYTRAIIDAILSGELSKGEFLEEPFFGLSIPKACPGVPSELLNPKAAWTEKAAYDKAAVHLASLFHKNFDQFADQASEEIRQGGPRAGKAT